VIASCDSPKPCLTPTAKSPTLTEVAGVFRTHYDAAITASLTGIGDVLGAEFLALVGGSLAGFASADRLAG
jgi:hypothetical protein